MPDVIELLTALVSTPSVSRDEAAVAARLDGWLRDHGLTPWRIDDNVMVTVEGEAPGPTFLLNSHLDTVAPVSGWESDPWRPFIDDGGRLVGLGSGDAKASVAAMASATVTLARRGLARGTLLLAATVMEEIGRGGMDVIRPQLGPIDAGFIGEPTRLEAAVAQGGLLILEATAHGKAAHAARAHLGVNALTVAARDLLRLDAFAFERVHPLLGPTTANATVIRGGERHNVLPDRCAYTIDVRTNPAYTHEELIERLTVELEAKLSVRSKRLRPVETATDAPIVRALRRARPSITTFGSPTMSDWAHLADIEGVKLGPGDSERSHTANESVDVAQVREAVDLYADAIDAYFAITAEERAL